MKHIAAYALLVLGGNNAPTAADVEKVMKDAGIKGDADKAAAVCAACKGKDFHSLVAEGIKAMSSMGGGSSAPTAASKAPAKAAEKVVEVVKEEEADVDMGDLFGGDY